MNFLELAKLRTSCRSYQDRPVPSETLAYCLEAAQVAPSACNQQPWRFVVVETPELRAELSKNALLPGIPMPWVATAPVIVVLCAKKSLAVHHIAAMVSGVHYHLIDLGIAGEHLVLAAAEQGLGSCWIGWFRAKQVRKILNLPRSLEPVSLITLGYPAGEAKTTERKPLSEIAEFQ
jgi:nitroreductase